MSFVFQNIANKSGLCSVDEFGVVNYKTRFIALMSILLMLSFVLLFGYITYHAEMGVAGATISDFSDAIWLMVMASTTIGFGDHYPVTTLGRTMVTLMFIFGVGIIGGLGALIAAKIFGFSDTNVKNRELRKQNAEIYQKLLTLEQLLLKDK
ncbi:voltage-gated potassium channel [Colwellia chukchiensis]|uniref:Voltage-gated potassium channel n=1 Tax=Colwellia chukchiensis TaxID=641665 RepID=A0A1H7J1J7_9GAMM|nr:potassium channel family protein [Colwellia chukchiensis]SEK68506.1 voltage-gated potassium channel [Colwellia chukchiensis]